MGSVHEETLSQNKGCHEFEAISLSEVNTIKSLIKNRTEFDEFYEAKKYESINPYSTNGTPMFHEIIECVYLDLERLIKNAKLTNQQRWTISKIMSGYAEQDLAKKLNTDVDNVVKVFETACKRIKQQNDFEWQEYIEINGYGKIPDSINYKQCKSCGKWLRINNQNFSPNDNSKDGFRNECKKCR